MDEQQLAAMRQALKRAFQLGQNYWSWADSEYSSHWKKADAAKAEFDKLVEDTTLTTPPAQEFVCSTGLCHYKPAAQPAVPDAIHHTDLSESLEYIQGWNDCRAEMLKGMKP